MTKLLKGVKKKQKKKQKKKKNDSNSEAIIENNGKDGAKKKQKNNFACSSCSRKFPTNQWLRDHERTHLRMCFFIFFFVL